jgi:hypothetical protein
MENLLTGYYLRDKRTKRVLNHFQSYEQAKVNKQWEEYKPYNTGKLEIVQLGIQNVIVG